MHSSTPSASITHQGFNISTQEIPKIIPRQALQLGGFRFDTVPLVIGNRNRTGFNLSPIPHPEGDLNPGTLLSLTNDYLLAPLKKMAAACRIKPIKSSSMPRRIILFLKASRFFILGTSTFIYIMRIELMSGVQKNIIKEPAMLIRSARRLRISAGEKDIL